MNAKTISFLRRAYTDQRGQMIPVIGFMMIVFLGFAGIVTDVGRAFFTYRLLLNSTNAAAMAGAQGLPISGSQALTNAQQYSGEAGKNNAYANLNVTNATYTLGCVTATVGANVPCEATGIGSSRANAIQVVQTASVPTLFMKLFGFTSIPIKATGTALMSGGSATPYNIAIVIDTTQSMTQTDSNCGSGVKRIQCALSGVQTFLKTISPCASSGCGTLTSGNYSNPVDRVSIFTFPEFAQSSQASLSYDCSATTRPTPTPYTYPASNGTSYSPGSSSPSYQITPFMTDYQTVDANGAPTGTLNNSGSGASNTVLAAGGQSNCAGMYNSQLGGEGTYFAGVIYAARAALLAQQKTETDNGETVKNAMIILSDGAATADSSQMSSSGLTGTGTYPDTTNECAQAVQAAQAATAAGITVYSVAYGAQVSGGCTTDLSSSTTVIINRKSVTIPAGITSACDTVKGMASDVSTTFYSDTSGVSGCSSPLAPVALGDIFKAIGANFSKTRLIPNGVFPTS